jgi:hypothetical protein
MTTARRKAVWTILALSTLAACSGRPNTSDAKTAAPAPAASPAPPASAASAGSPAPAAAPADPSGGATVNGTVLETMDASNYTYVRVKAGSREIWAAASQFKVAVNDKVVFSLDQPMENFHSQALNRDFPLIYFVSRIAHEGEAAALSMAVAHAPTQEGAAPAKPAAPVTVITPMDPAPGGMTVAAVWKDRSTLVGKKVTVRGKVVKYNGGILGVNWIHLQDGSGKAADGTNDITVTSETDAKVGDIVTVTGVVGVNKDLGSGYQYPVIIEHATLTMK